MQTPVTPDDLFKIYQSQPSQSNLNTVVQALRPAIDYAVQSAGASGDPYVRSMALAHAAKAVKKFDPTKAGASNLRTYVGSELQQIGRIARRSRSVLQLPERTQLDAYALMKARKGFESQHGREPDAGELADFSGYSIKRIEKVMKQTRAVSSESSLPSDTEKTDTDFQPEAVDYVYHDADHIDRRILEHKTGFGGAEILEPKMIAAKLKLTPSQLSRRSAKLALRINEIENALKSV